MDGSLDILMLVDTGSVAVTGGALGTVCPTDSNSSRVCRTNRDSFGTNFYFNFFVIFF